MPTEPISEGVWSYMTPQERKETLRHTIQETLVGATPTQAGVSGASFKPGEVQVHLKSRINANVRMRPEGDLASKPRYATVALYLCTTLETGREGVFIEFGPGMTGELMSPKNTTQAYDIYLPTNDPSVSFYVGSLVRQKNPPDPKWVWDLVEESAEIIDLLHRRFPDAGKLEQFSPREQGVTHSGWLDAPTWPYSVEKHKLLPEIEAREVEIRQGAAKKKWSLQMQWEREALWHDEQVQRGLRLDSPNWALDILNYNREHNK